jgi:hypothetical protein
MHEQEIGNTFGRAVHEYLFCSKAPCANLAIFSHFCRLAGSRASLSFAPINALIVAPYELLGTEYRLYFRTFTSRPNQIYPGG